MLEEEILGGHFIVNVWVNADTYEVETSDDLKDTVDYVKIIEIVKEQMAIKADMIEVQKELLINLIFTKSEKS